MKRQLLADIIAGLFIVLFVYTALSKLYEMPTFQATLEQSPLISNYFSLISWVIPIVELATALLLFMPRTKLWGLYSSFVLMLTFTLYIAYMLLNTSNLPCSCGGVLKQMTWKQHLVFNIFFTLLSLVGILLIKRKTDKDITHKQYKLA